MKLPEFDIVIPSTGEPSTHNLLKSIEFSTILPNNVIVVIRDVDQFYFDPESFSFPITLLRCPNHGQVYQRIFGFQNCHSSLVMQIDADCSFDSSFLFRYITEFLRVESISDCDIALSPSFLDSNTRPMFSSETHLSFLYRLLLSSIGLMYSNKNLSKFGQNFSLNMPSNSFSKSNQTFHSDWLPGGCMMLRKNSLVVDNYYPFMGKAYAEDLFHSYLLFSKSVSLFVFYGINVTTEAHPALRTYRDFCKSLLIYFRISVAFCSFTGFPAIFSLLICIPYVKSFFTLLSRKFLHLK